MKPYKAWQYNKTLNTHEVTTVYGTKYIKRNLDAFIYYNDSQGMYWLVDRKSGQGLINAKKKKDIDYWLEKLIEKVGEEEFYNRIERTEKIV